MVLIFALIRFIPGDPADVMLGARATEESRAMLHAKMGIDKPIYEQFFLFMKNCLRLDFGESILSGEPVSQILARRFQVTASLTGMTALFTMLLALPIGYFSGVNKHNAAGKAMKYLGAGRHGGACVLGRHPSDVFLRAEAALVSHLRLGRYLRRTCVVPHSAGVHAVAGHLGAAHPQYAERGGADFHHRLCGFCPQQGPCTHARARVVHPAQRNDLHHHAFLPSASPACWAAASSSKRCSLCRGSAH